MNIPTTAERTSGPKKWQDRQGQQPTHTHMTAYGKTSWSDMTERASHTIKWAIPQTTWEPV